jgi:HEAT repeat protein/energy-coupling factor transporter ATP-binding protein EcfA2
MPLVETLLVNIVEKVFDYLLDQTDIQGRLRDKLGLNPTRRAFHHALGKAAKQFEQKHAQWVESLFDLSFFAKEGSSILAQFLLPDGHPDPSVLAERWAEAINILQPERRSVYVRELEPVAADFLGTLARELKAESDLREINDSRALDQIAENTLALCQQVEANRATRGTCRDYLNWIVAQHRYLDPRGIPQTHRQVQVKLDEVYISLRAQFDETPGAVDRRLLEQEIKELEAAIAVSQLPVEEMENLREQLFARFEQRQPHKSALHNVVELAEVVKQNDRLVILGDPGSGKTTLLRYLALKHAQALQANCLEADDQLGAVRFPILIRIAEYAEGGVWKAKPLSDFLASYCALHECQESGLADLLATELENGRCLVLLDGLDEVVNADDRRGVVQRIDDFVRRYSSRPNRFVITSRIAGYRSAPVGGDFAHYAVQEMDEKQIRRFLERWCLAVEAAQTPDQPPEARETIARREITGILDAVNSSPGVRRLATNPLLLCTLALIHRTGARLPEKRIDLYKLAAEVLARSWRIAHGIHESDLIKDEHLTPLLSRLAYWLHENKPTGIATEQEVYHVLGEEWATINDLPWDEERPSPTILTEIKRFLEAVRVHTGLFVERAPQRYGFMHLTFEEYYVARALVALSRTRAALIRQHLHDSRWEEPILLALGLVGLESPQEVTSLVETAILAEGEEARALGFVPSLYEELLGRDYLFALRCLGDQIPVNIRLVRRLVERLVDELLHMTGPTRFSRYRQALIERLKSLKGGRVVSQLIPYLLAALRDTDILVRYIAAYHLGWLGQTSPEVVTALLATLHDEDATMRFSAAVSLRQLGQASPEVDSALLAALRDRSVGSRRIAAERLGQLEQTTPEIIAALLTALRDKSANVRSQAAESLGQLGQTTPEITAALLAALHDTDFSVGRSTITSLGHLGQTSPEIVTALLALLQDQDASVRFSAAWSLGELGQTTPEIIAALLRALQEQAANVRSQAAESLGELGQTTPEIIAALLRALQDQTASVRRSAAMALGHLGQTTPEILTALLRALHDQAARVRRSAAIALGHLGQTSPEIIATLLDGLQSSKESWTRYECADLIGQIGEADQPTIQALLQGLLDGTSFVRSTCATALARLQRLAEGLNQVIR